MADIAVKATMYYQAIPPFFLQQLFKLKDPGDATKRLYYMASRLETKGTPIEDWKLPLVSATVEVVPRPTPRPATAPRGKVAGKTIESQESHTRGRGRFEAWTVSKLLRRKDLPLIARAEFPDGSACSCST